MTPGDWILLAALMAPLTGSVLVTTVKLTIVLTSITNRLADHEKRLEKAGL